MKFSTKQIIQLLILCIFPLLFSEIVLSATITPQYFRSQIVEVDKFITQKNYEQAYQKLKILKQEFAGDPFFDLLYATVANEVNEFGEAILALERVIAFEPDNIRARAELAKSYFYQGEWDTAHEEFSETRKNDIAPEVERSVENYMSEIRRRKGNHEEPLLSGYFQVSIGHDSNVNRGVNDALVTVPLFGQLLAFYVSPDGLEISDSYKSIEAGTIYRYPLSANWVAHGGLSFDRQYNNDDDFFDQGMSSGYIAMDYKNNAELFTLGYRKGNYHFYERSYQKSDSYMFQWQHSYNAGLRVGTFYQWADLEYPDLHYQDANRQTIGINAAMSLSSIPLGVYSSFYLADEDVNNSLFDPLGHDDIGLTMGARYRVNESIDVFSNIDLQKRHYDAEDRLFKDTRKDDYINASIGTSWSFNQNWMIKLEYNYSDNNSNIDINDYDREDISASLRWDF